MSPLTIHERHCNDRRQTIRYRRKGALAWLCIWGTRSGPRPILDNPDNAAVTGGQPATYRTAPEPHQRGACAIVGHCRENGADTLARIASDAALS